MRGVRRVRRHREWEVDGDASFPHTPDAEATPMISQPHHWHSFFPRNATDRQHLSSRIKQGMVTPAITTAVRSIRRLFGRGPIPVSRVAVPEAFDIESSDSETDPFDTLRSKTRRGPFANLRQNVASGSDRGASSYTLTHPSEGTRDSSTLDADLESDRGLDHGVANGAGGGNGADDHDNAGDHVMVIGQNFSSGGSLISLRRGDGRPVEADQSSIEVVPPTPTLDSRPFRAGAYHARSASTPHLPSPSSSSTPISPSFSPSTDDLPSRGAPPPPPTPFLLQSASGIRARPSGKDALRTYYTSAAPPTRPAEKQSHNPSEVATAPTLSLRIGSPVQRTRRKRGAHSPPLSPQLQNYMPSFPGRSPPGSPYALPNSVPSSPISASDPQNLIPSAVRGAGYNPFQHGRSASDLG
ncbi:hypothetical protein EDB92DRAFT_1814550 [Lactarius akahatsu]|uniref:Uncharacterized protein n=1 Tax=Lactarius akahatsu TaxID=416441 RepID=A0AAD4LLX2_9AGAM|nr:hypothetical protein EDB92DRAFT_1814550 [Lactarius akahatsu]